MSDADETQPFSLIMPSAVTLAAVLFVCGLIVGLLIGVGLL
jgi:hypothetical protein